MVASKKPPPPRGGLPIVKTIDLTFSHTKWSEFTLRWRNALLQILINFLQLMISLICWSKWLSISSQFLNFECCCVCLPSIAWWEHFTCSLISKLIGSWQQKLIFCTESPIESAVDCDYSTRKKINQISSKILHWISKKAEKTSNQASQIPVIGIRISMRKICCFLKILESWKIRRAEIKLMDEVWWIKNGGGLMCWIGWWPMLQIHFFAAMHCCRVFTRDILVAAMHQCNASNSVLGWDQNAIHCQLCCCSFTRGIFQLWLNRN